MLEFAHAATGAIIAYKINSPALALPLAFGSHFLIDQLPHWNFNLDDEKLKQGKITLSTMIFIFLDSFLGLILGLLVAAQAFPNWSKIIVIIAGAFLGVLPDLLEAPFYFWNWQNKLISKLLNFQKKHQWNISFWPGMLIQITYLFFLFSLLKL